VNDLALPLPQPVRYPTPYSAMIAQAQLAIIANKIYNEFLTAHISNPSDNEDLVCKFDEELSHWRNALPSYFASQEVPGWFQGPRAVILWKEQNLRMMLWLGGQRSNRIRPRSGDAIRNCALVALESVQAISEFCTEHEKLHQGLSWYATYFLFQAVLMLDVCLLQASNDSQTSLWRNATDQGRQCLSELGTTNPTALRCISILDRINKHYPSIASNQTWHTSQYQGPNLFPGLGETSSQGVETDHPVQQPYSDDPALHLFLDVPPMANFFDGVHGFSSIQEYQNFDYVTGDFYNMNNFDTAMN
jgi:transcriptional regulatory protein GAL4